MQLVMNPYQYDTLAAGKNLYGDIVSDLCAGPGGADWGLVPGANLGLNCAIFESGARLGS